MRGSVFAPASWQPPLPRGALGHPETPTHFLLCFSQSSRRAAGKKDAVRLWVVTVVAWGPWGSRWLTDAGRWGWVSGGQGISLRNLWMENLSQGRLEPVLGWGQVSPGGAVSGLGQ